MATNRGAKRGRLQSTSLFKDGTYDIDHFHRKFLQLDDPTEYMAAMDLIGSWQEWLRLKKESVWFRTQVREWLDELEIKQRAEAIAKVRMLADSDKASAFQANKWLAERRYAEISKAGRPSEKELAKEAKLLAKETAASEEEADRVEAALLYRGAASAA